MSSLDDMYDDYVWVGFGFMPREVASFDDEAWDDYVGRLRSLLGFNQDDAEAFARQFHPNPPADVSSRLVHRIIDVLEGHFQALEDGESREPDPLFESELTEEQIDAVVCELDDYSEEQLIISPDYFETRGVTGPPEFHRMNLKQRRAMVEALLLTMQEIE